MLLVQHNNSSIFTFNKMFVKVLASTAAVASGVVLRGMSFDAAANKVLMPNWGTVSDNDLLYYEVGTDSGTAGTAQGGLADKKVYMVTGADQHGFKLKAVADADLAAGDAITMTTATAGTKTNTFTKISDKRSVKSNAAQNAGLVLGTSTGAYAEDATVILYCGAANCGLKGDQNSNAVLDAYKSGTVLNMGAAVTAADDQTWAFGAIETAVDTAITQASLTNSGNDATAQTNLFLLVKSSTVRFPVLDANAYDVTANKITGAHPFATDDPVFYTAGTAQGALVNNTLYYVRAASQGKEFKLGAHNANTAETKTNADIDITDATAESGGALQKIKTVHAHNKLVGATATGNILTAAGTSHGLAADDFVIFYCTDKTAGKCDWKGPVDGATYKVKAVDTTDTSKKITLTDGAATSPADIAVSTDVSTQNATDNPAYLLEKADKVGNTADTKTDAKWTIIAAPAGASAARGLAMFGSAVAMATAFLMG